ncbi:MAG: cytochrome c oxidase accessory protein CcoG [Cyclobacteriaceae bacterium]|nr:cytochrome c oxidase accessory protein CcoG [Cyclobacteriaceae bacterium]
MIQEGKASEAVEQGSELYQFDEEFRNSISTVDESGHRVWLYPKKPSGTYHNRRIVVTVILLALFFAGPFIQIGGRPILLLNFFERKFVVFGQAFWPQDFVLLALTLITFFVFVILFTVVFGRLWCGWACPQTLFMEMVFRKIEYWIEGDANQQRRLDRMPWNTEKITKKGFKQLLFLLLSIIIAHIAMAYLIGKDQALAIVQESPSEHVGGFMGMVAFTGIFYSVFAYFREQACVVVCPYGRLQGVLLIKDSIVVAYDWLRGEPRGRRRKASAEAPKTGDCIDCKLCVHVCPTGIDIRNGTQLECVNCTACMDACDDIMVKINKPKGLIRYASYNSIKNGIQLLFTPRVIGYSVVLLALITILSFTLATRSDVETTVLKVPGTLFQRTDDGFFTNLYTIEFVNKTFDPLQLKVKVESPSTATLVLPEGSDILLPAEGLMKRMCFIKLPADAISEARTIVIIGVYQEDRLLEKVKVKFVGPVKSSR